MKVTFFSVLMAVLFSGILILLSYSLRRRLWLVRAFGTHSLIALYLGCALRLLLVSCHNKKLLPVIVETLRQALSASIDRLI